MNFVDTHTHLYAEEFDTDRNEVIHRALENHVSTLLLPAIDSAYHEKLLCLVSGFPELCFPMMGLHPTSVKENFRDELVMVEKFLLNPNLKFYAVGEIGIDFYWDKSFEKEQKLVFVHQVEVALSLSLPLEIHTRNSMEVTLSLLEERKSPNLSGVFHCFSGNLDQAERAIALGFRLGIGGVVTYKNSGLQKVVENTGLEHLLLETDAPWLPPAPYRGKRNEPSYLPFIAKKIAEIKNIPLEEVAAITSENARTLFKLN
ncbi:MAG: TatD family hydrolase [Bacteroidales bacterium]|nr:TatD family hydrolase [Bacteroidales bacterium]MDD4602589.1 TatD family hydrolase [Bacteroidales bacterium]